jgi:hypothetical protein
MTLTKERFQQAVSKGLLYATLVTAVALLIFLMIKVPALGVYKLTAVVFGWFKLLWLWSFILITGGVYFSEN